MDDVFYLMDKLKTQSRANNPNRLMADMKEKTEKLKIQMNELTEKFRKQLNEATEKFKIQRAMYKAAMHIIEELKIEDQYECYYTDVAVLQQGVDELRATDPDFSFPDYENDLPDGVPRFIYISEMGALLEENLKEEGISDKDIEMIVLEFYNSFKKPQ